MSTRGASNVIYVRLLHERAEAGPRHPLARSLRACTRSSNPPTTTPMPRSGSSFQEVSWSARSASWERGASSRRCAVQGPRRAAHMPHRSRSRWGGGRFKYNYKNVVGEVRISSGGALVLTRSFDCRGRQVGLTPSAGGARRQVYCGDQLALILDLSNNNVLQEYVFNPNEIDRALMVQHLDVLDDDEDGNTAERTRSYFHCNGIVSVMQLTGASQVEVAR